VEDFVAVRSACGSDLLLVASLVGQSLRRSAGVTFTAATAGVHPEEVHDEKHKLGRSAQHRIEQGLKRRWDR
jgi:hypothetical protein